MTRRRRTVVVAAAVAAIVTAANASDGAYFSQSWGWVALAFLVPTTVLLILDRVAVPGRLRIAFAAFVGALGVWIALSAVWSISTSASVREAERMLVYVALALAVALVLRRGDGPGVLGEHWPGSPSRAATRSPPASFRIGSRRSTTRSTRTGSRSLSATGMHWVSSPLWDSSLRSDSSPIRVGQAWESSLAAAIPMLALTLYFTFSRGAWAALVIGLGASIATDPRRLRLVWTALVVGVPSVVCVAYAARHEALTTEDAPVAAADARRAPRRRRALRRDRRIRSRSSWCTSCREPGQPVSQGDRRLRPRACGFGASPSPSWPSWRWAACQGFKSASTPSPSPASI